MKSLTFSKAALALTAVLSLPMASFAVDSAQRSMQSPGPVNRQQVLEKVHAINEFEIQGAQMAEKKANASDVKKFATLMIQDHSAADRKIMELAQKEKLTLQTLPPTAEQQKQVAQLRAASGAEFDRIYMEINRQGHEKAVAFLQQAQKQVRDPQVAKLISQLLPKIEHHYQMAENLQLKTSQTAS